MTAPADNAQNFGALDLPVPVAADDATAGDPCLDVVGAYLQAVLNATAGDAWAAIAPTTPGATGATSPPVKSVLTNDPGGPEGVGFRTQDLPSIYLVREGSDQDPQWIADDYLITRDTLTVLWVFPLRTQAKHALRSNYVNALVKIMINAVEQGRHPAWIQGGDTDPKASTQGSFFWELAGIWRIYTGRWRTRPVEIGDGADKARYGGVEIKFHLEERDRQPLGPGLQAAVVTIQTTDAPPYVTNELLLPTP